MKTILIFGDSIVYGASDEEKGGWINRLRLFLESNQDIEVYNLGICGDNTKLVLKRFENEVNARWGQDDRELIIIFSVGANDTQYVKDMGNRIKIGSFEKNIRLLKEKAEKYTKKVIFCGLNDVDEKKSNPIPWNNKISYLSNEIKKYDEVLKKFCMQNKVKFIEIIGLVRKEDLADGLHPNSKGHEKIFKKVRDFLSRGAILR